MFQPEGVFTALITPMNGDESINYRELRRQVDRQIAAGIHGLFCLGTNGEFYVLHEEEKIEIARTIVDQVAGRVPVLANIGCVSTADSVGLAQAISSLGVDALSAIIPYFAGLSQEQLYRHYETIAASTELPLLIYNIPARTGNSIEAETVQRLSQIDNILGIKDSSGNMEHMKRILELTDEDFTLLVGTDSLILDVLEAGGRGAVAGCGNPFPELMAGIYDAWKAGDMKTARARQERIGPFRSTFSHGNPNSIVKRAMVLLGYEVGPAREPANILNSEADAALKKVFPLYDSIP